MRIRRIFTLAAATAAVLALLPATPGSSVGLRSSSWAPAATASVHPGVQTFTEGAQCTANFVFADTADVYLGQAAHCAGTGAATETDGCLAKSLPLGTLVEIDGATRPGTLVYSSWLTMQARGETDADTCANNDFALVKLDPVDVGRVNPSIPFWGGPVSLGGETSLFEEVYTYGNSGLRFGLTPLSPKVGTSLGTGSGGWSHTTYTVTPGIPGDSGSAFLDREGRAIGVLSTLNLIPMPGANSVSDLASALSYLRAHTELDAVQLVPGTEPFSPLL